MLIAAALPLHAQRPDASPATGAVMQYRGLVKRVKGGSLLLSLDDTRPLLLKTSGKTKYIQNDQPAKASAVKPGDWLAVEAALDTFSQLQAITITVLPSAEANA